MFYVINLLELNIFFKMNFRFMNGWAKLDFFLLKLFLLQNLAKIYMYLKKYIFAQNFRLDYHDHYIDLLR